MPFFGCDETPTKIFGKVKTAGKFGKYDSFLNDHSSKIFRSKSEQTKMQEI